VIHAFALEPELVATWGERAEFRFICDKFGLGTPRMLLELPKFSAWKKAVYEAAQKLGLPDTDMTRVAELLSMFGEHKHRRADTIYDGLLSWLENAEREYGRRAFAGILAIANPRSHEAVLVSEQLSAQSARWACAVGASPQRTPAGLAAEFAPMLTHCYQLHLIDPHFGPENRRHSDVLSAFMNVLVQGGGAPRVIRVHCAKKSEIQFFQDSAKKMAPRLPVDVTIEFVRWRERQSGERLHNRYILTDVGGVSLGIGLDAGGPGETDDLSLLTRDQYALRWEQYVLEKGFDCVDRPANVVGTRTRR